ncbi:hypothetical protein LZ575_03365 [Antarcticibacterium sp. 1MA-6-2]|uniref:hypothetical protein n=1 Tax=Antarcticibacterium sp. 1MA-6-2 TaxID=2908210 RepID=UPI001F23C637|nr:hypothetical protein [Antarcticibacterium sp. 1MA-6-2]UJH91735.1 hypothetical protein LZ575_03365 [Antarcticibacterium sp. 1MA-6-2]
MFSGQYVDLQNKPELYSKSEIDNLIQGIETTGGSPQNLNLEGQTLTISGGNSISFENWDTNAADDFSGSYEDLQNKVVLFSGQYVDLQNKPELYSKSEIDNLIQGIETTGGSPQNLNLEGQTLTISGGNSISFENWDTNAADDFSGRYMDLQDKPELYSKTEIDNLIQGIETTGGSPQNLNLEGQILTISGGNSISFENWDTNAADDFSGSYEDLQNKPVLFSGQYEDLQNKPELYSKTEIDNLIQGIESTGGSPQNLNLEGQTLTISGGNSISFENWDTNAADDFSGIYDDLQNKPELYSKTEIDNLIQGIESTGGSPQNLNLEGQTLTISGGNSISFENWDTNAADDFSGSYEDLQNKPVLFSGQYVDLQNKPELYSKSEIDNLIQGIESTGGSPQNLNLEGQTLTISGGNSISFENWDTNAADDFDGEYASLNGAPKVYTQEEVDAIKAEILVHVKENYSPKARVVSLSSSRNAISTDVGNTLACITSATLTITSTFSGMQIGDIINLEVHGTTLTVTGGTGVVINGTSGGNKSIGNNEIYTYGLIRKIANNSYIVL